MHEDTIKLLKECNSGVKMGVTSIDEVLDKVKDGNLKGILTDYKEQHSKLGDDTHILLNECHDDGKEPHPIAKSMSWMKINMKMAMDSSDKEIASLMTDGCNMGVKSLKRYLNQYQNADDKAKRLTEKIIKLEENMAEDMSKYL